MSKYFYDNGYFNCENLVKQKQCFYFILGGRGTGKTYSFTNWACNNATPKKKFLFMRRTDVEMSMVNASNIYVEHHADVTIKTINKQISGVYCGESEEPIGYHCALSTLHNIRGFNMMDVSTIIFDEFIAERGTVVRRYGGEQMLNAYETVNRNRELQGGEPVKCFFLSNFNTTESDIMQSFGFTDELYKYIYQKPLGVYQDELKKLIMINESPITEKKKKTVLYQVNANKEFNEMAIENIGISHVMPIKHYSRKSYVFISHFGIVNVNRLHNGFYYITENNSLVDYEEPDQKLLLRMEVIYRAYTFGNVYASSDYVANAFINYFEKNS